MKTTKRSSTAARRKEAKERVQPNAAEPAGKTPQAVQRLVHLLQVNQFELEHQNQELRIAEAELEASRTKYVNLFDLSPIAYFVLSLDGAMKEVNIAAAKMLGIDRRKLIGEKLILHITREDQGAFTAFVKNVFASAVKKSCKVLLTGKDKRTVHVQLEGLKLDALPGAEQECQIAAVDLTAYKNVEK